MSDRVNSGTGSSAGGFDLHEEAELKELLFHMIHILKIISCSYCLNVFDFCLRDFVISTELISAFNVCLKKTNSERNDYKTFSRTFRTFHVFKCN